MDYTKRPWITAIATETGFETLVLGNNGDDGMVADCHASWRRHEENEANARVMSAAPDLLDALESLYEWVEECWPEYRPDELMAKAEAAAAKAGQTLIIQAPEGKRA